VVRTLERQGFFQQLTWSPDGRWLSGVANSFGTGWSVARMHAGTGAVNAVSRVDCCTPDWFPDGQQITFSNRPPPKKRRRAGPSCGSRRRGKTRRLSTARRRHVYGGQVSPDGKYVLFTGNMREDGDPVTGSMGLLRADAPIIGGESRSCGLALEAQPHP
jgi:Tol biopolymer transport system component